jgi:hypothetical protein
VRYSPRVRFRPSDILMVQLDVKISDLHHSGGSEPDMRFILDHSEQCLHCQHSKPLVFRRILGQVTRVC